MNINKITESNTKFSNKELEILGFAYESSWNNKVELLEKEFTNDEAHYILDCCRWMNIPITGEINNNLCFSPEEFEAEKKDLIKSFKVCDVFYNIHEEMEALETILFNIELLKEAHYYHKLPKTKFSMRVEKNNWIKVCNNIFEAAKDNVLLILKTSFNTLEEVN